jgi:hypothetical protein
LTHIGLGLASRLSVHAQCPPCISAQRTLCIMRGGDFDVFTGSIVARTFLNELPKEVEYVELHGVFGEVIQIQVPFAAAT